MASSVLSYCNKWRKFIKWWDDDFLRFGGSYRIENMSKEEIINVIRKQVEECRNTEDTNFC
jgi:hypothetical protein